MTVAPAHAALDVAWTRTSTTGITGYLVEAHAGSTVVTRTVPRSATSTALAVPRAGQPYRVRVYPLRGSVRGTPAQAARSVASWPAVADIPVSVRAEPLPDDPLRWRVVLEAPPAGWGAVRSATVVARNLSEPGSFDLETGTSMFDAGPVVLDQYEAGPGPYRVTYTLVYRDGGIYTGAGLRVLPRTLPDPLRRRARHSRAGPFWSSRVSPPAPAGWSRGRRRSAPR